MAKVTAAELIEVLKSATLAEKQALVELVFTTPFPPPWAITNSACPQLLPWIPPGSVTCIETG